MTFRSLKGVLAVACAGCVVPKLDPTGKVCSADELCPAGFACFVGPGGTSGVCREGPGGVVLEACVDAGVGLACTAGLGACARTGVVECVQAAPRCSAVPGAPFAESCNGLDDDCDGLTDLQPDAGALRDARPCALTLGVCAGAHPGCIDGGFEAACGAAAYGPDFEPLETRCDGLDNDCDGRADISRAVELVPDASESVVWLAVDGGLAALAMVQQGGSPNARPTFVRFGWDLEPQSAPLDLAPEAAGSAGHAAVRRLGDELVATWSLGDLVCSLYCEPTRLLVARLDAFGAHRWLGLRADGGPGPSALLVGQAELAAPPAVAVSSDGERVLVLWATVDAGVWAAAVSADAGAAAAPRRLEEACEPSTPSDGGRWRGATPERVAVAGMGQGFLAGWHSRAGAGEGSLALSGLDAAGGQLRARCLAQQAVGALSLSEGPVAVWQSAAVSPALQPGPLQALFGALDGGAAFELAAADLDVTPALEAQRLGGAHYAAYVFQGKIHLRRFDASGPAGPLRVIDAGTLGNLSVAAGPGATLAVSYYDQGSRRAFGVLTCRP